MEVGRVRTIVLIMCVLLATLCGLWLMLYHDGGLPGDAPRSEFVAHPSASIERAPLHAPLRSTIAVEEPREQAYPSAILDDPLFRASLGGVTGRLVDSEGQALAGIEVVGRSLNIGLALRGDASDPVIYPWQAARALSDAGGRFVLSGLQPPVPVHLSIGRESGWAFVREFDLDHIFDTPALGSGSNIDLGDIPLVLSGEIMGRVTGPKGEPFPNALVQISAWEESEFEGSRISSPTGIAIIKKEGICHLRVQGPAISPAIPECFEVQTDARGHFQVSSLPPIRYEVCVQVRGQHLPVIRQVDCASGRKVDVGEIRLRSQSTLKCRVVDSSGLPVGGVELAVASAISRSAKLDLHLGVRAGLTDSDGRLSIQGYPSEFVSLAVRRPGHAWSFLVDVPASQEITIALDATHDLRLNVRDGAGQYIGEPKFTLRALDDATRERFGLNNISDGVLSIDPIRLESDGAWSYPGLDAGRYELRIEDRSADLVSVSVIDFDGDATLEVTLLPPRLLTLSVTDGHGTAIEFCRVDADYRCMGWTDNRGELAVVVTGLDQVRFEFNHPAFDWQDLELDLIPARQDVRLRPLCTIRGQLHVSGIQPSYEKLDLSFFTHEDVDELDGMNDWVTIDARGRFTVATAVAGAYSVSVYDELGDELECGIQGSEETEFEVKPGLNAVLHLDVDWSPPVARGQFHGVVTLDGEPAIGLEVQNRFASELETPSVKTDSRGRFDFGPVYGEEVAVYVSGIRHATHDTDSLWNETYPTGHQGLQEVFIDILTGSITGRVLGLDSKPLSQIKVRAVARKRDEEFFAFTKADGRFTFPRVTKGAYRLWVRQDRARGFSPPFVVTPGTNLEVPVRMEVVVSVEGRLDFSALGIGGVESARVRLHERLRLSDRTHGNDNGFNFRRVSPGRYAVSVALKGAGEESLILKSAVPVVVGSADIEGIVIHLDSSHEDQILEQAKAKGLSASRYLESLGLKLK